MERRRDQSIVQYNDERDDVKKKREGSNVELPNRWRGREIRFMLGRQGGFSTFYNFRIHMRVL